MSLHFLSRFYLYLVLWWITVIIVVFILSGISFFSHAYEFVGLRYRQARAKALLTRFDEMMTLVGNGTVIGTPLAPNEQVLRAVCNCGVALNAHQDFYRVSAMSPIVFSCDVTTASYNRMPPTPNIPEIYTEY